MLNLEYDVAVIGAGAAGLTVAAKCGELGLKTLVIDRDEVPGGVLNQCIHNGFGLHYFKTELTGPEYAARVYDAACRNCARFLFQATVMKITPGAEPGCRAEVTVYSGRLGVVAVAAHAVVLAMGCRERCRGNLGIPGDRPAGVFTAGLAQRLINLEGLLPGRRALIVGSGDIGLIMARRLIWCGVEVRGVAEIMPYPAGLPRNIAQCLEDFDIPLHLSTSVTGIYGRDRVERVTMAPLIDGRPDLERETSLECDTVLFSVGLVPEMELGTDCHVTLDPATGGARINAEFMTGVPGVFACGNVLHVHDLVDFVSEEAELCAAGVARYLAGRNAPDNGGFTLTPGPGLRYVTPSRCGRHETVRCSMRPCMVADHAVLTVTAENIAVLRRELRYVKPAEMISFDLKPAELAAVPDGATLEFRLKELENE